MLGVFLGLGSALAFGGGDFAGGMAARRASSMVVAAGAQATGLAILLAALVVIRPAVPALGPLGIAALAGAFGGIGLLALYRGLAMGSMGLVTALSGAGSVIIPLAVSFVGGASISALQWVGVAAALGAALTASGATFAGVRVAALLLAGAAAIGFGLWFTFLDVAAPSGELWTLVGSRAAATVLLGAVVATRGRNGGGASAQWRAAGWIIAVAGLLDVTGNAAFVLARGQVPVGVAAALSGVYPIVTMLLARGVAGERMPPLGVGAVLLAVTGVVLIALGS